MKILKFLTCTLLALQLAFGTFFIPPVSAKSSDYENHWAEKTINEWLSYELIKGYPDGSFKPNQSITRAEFVSLMNRVFHIEGTHHNIAFTDVLESNWAYDAITAAYTAGYIKGTSETTFSPNSPITRQEAAVMVANFLGWKEQDELSFKDADQVAVWSKSAIAALVKVEYIQGDPSGNLRPKDTLKRAEAIKLLHSAGSDFETVINESGTYGSIDNSTVFLGNVRISSEQVTLLNAEVRGNLIIDEAVGEGDVYLNQVKVAGETFLYGGGEHSVYLEDSIMFRIIVEKTKGKIRIVALGGTTVTEVYVKSSIKIESSTEASNGFKNIILSDALPAGSEIELIGYFENVNVLRTQLSITIPKGSIDHLFIDEKASNTEITLSKEASILSLIVNAISKILGEGQIQKVTLSEKAIESTFATKPSSIEFTQSNQPVPVIPTPITPTPTTTPINDSKDASLHNISFDNKDDFLLEKANLPINSELEVFEFSPEHLSYITVLPTEFEAETISFTLQTAAQADIQVQLYDKQDSATLKTLTPVNNLYSFNINSLNPHYVLEILITSEDHNYIKTYNFSISIEHSINQAFRFNKLNSHSLETSSFKSGDLIEITIPQEFSNTGEVETITKTIDSSEYKDGSYVSTSIYMHPFTVTDSKNGNLKIVVTRGNEIILSGNYKFDFNTVDIQRLDQSMYEVSSFSSKEQLDEFNATTPIKNAYFFKFSLDQDQILELYPDTRFVGLMFYNTKVEAIELTVEDLKINNYYHDIPGRKLPVEPEGFTEFYGQTDLDENGKYHVYSKKQIIIPLYDSNDNLIKVILCEVDIPEDKLSSDAELIKIVE